MKERDKNIEKVTKRRNIGERDKHIRKCREYLTDDLSKIYISTFEKILEEKKGNHQIFIKRIVTIYLSIKTRVSR